MIPEFEAAIRFDRLKTIDRMCFTGTGRPENSAEHSWHAVMLAYLLSNYAPPGVDINRVAMMLTLHDLPEIIAGDTFFFDAAANPKIAQSQTDAEYEAACQLFDIDSSRGVPIGDGLLAMWLEFNNGQSADAKFAKAIDRLHPLLQQFVSNGKTFRKHGISMKQIKNSLAEIDAGCPKIWPHVEMLLIEMNELGMLPPFPPVNSQTKAWRVKGRCLQGTPNIGDTLTIGDHLYTVLSYFMAKDVGSVGLALSIQSCPEAPAISMEFSIESKEIK